MYLDGDFKKSTISSNSAFSSSAPATSSKVTFLAYIFGEVANLKHNALNISDGYNSGTDNSLFFYYIRTCKKRIYSEYLF